MRAMHLKHDWQLDALLAAPTSQDAEWHREPPDEAYELAERLYEEVDRQRSAQEEFEALFKARYLN
jgi:Skp family chaperone for outer membrane proteins